MFNKQYKFVNTIQKIKSKGNRSTGKTNPQTVNQWNQDANNKNK